MLTKNDELFCHQTVSTFDRPGTSAREWTERAWILLHDKAGTMHLASGFGYYPNRNIMDTFACFVVEDKTLFFIRASRELRPDIDQFTVGPLSYEIAEPLKKIHFVLGENEYDLSFDVTIDAYSPPHEEGTGQFQLSRGRVKEHICRFVQAGKPSGWIKTGGKTYNINKDEWTGLRDRSWGIRIAGAETLETGVQPPEGYMGGPGTLPFNFELMQFEDWGASFHIREGWDSNLNMPRLWHFTGGIFYPLGSGKEELPLISVEHDYQFTEDSIGIRKFAGGNIILNAIDGTRKEVSVRRQTICYKKPGGYGHYKGFIHGLWMGSFWIDGGTLDLTNPDIMREVWGYCDYGSEFRCDGQVGYGTSEGGAGPDYIPSKDRKAR